MNRVETLKQLQTDLMTRIEAIKRDLSQEKSSDFAEQATENENNDVLVRLKSDAETELKQVAHALDFLQTGNEFECESCGDEIPSKRIEAVPYATLCVTCADKVN